MVKKRVLFLICLFIGCGFAFGIGNIFPNEFEFSASISGIRLAIVTVLWTLTLFYLGRITIRKLEDSPHIQPVILIGIAAAVSLLTLWLAAFPVPIPREWRTLEIIAPAVSTPQKGRLYVEEIKIDGIGVIPLNKVKQRGKWIKDVNGLRVDSEEDASLRYHFSTGNTNRSIQILSLKHPDGGNFIVNIDGERIPFNTNSGKIEEARFNLQVKHHYPPQTLLLYFCIFINLSVIISLLIAWILILTQVRIEAIHDTPFQGPGFSLITKCILAACMGLIMALIISGLIPEHINHTALQTVISSASYAVDDWKLREKILYFLLLSLGFCAAFLAGYQKTNWVRRPFYALFGLALWLPALNEAVREQVRMGPERIVWMGLVILLFGTLVWSACIVSEKRAKSLFILYLAESVITTIVIFFRMVRFDFDATPELILSGLFWIAILVILQLTWKFLPNKKIENRLKDLLSGFYICLLILPASITDLAMRMGDDVHAPFHLFAPAMYSHFGRGLAPGLYYFTQYSVGAPVVFAPFLGNIPQQTRYAYVIMMVLTMLIFFLSAFFILKKAMNSRTWALGMVSISLFLQFSDKSMHLGIPSMSVFRFPFLPLALGAFLLWHQSGYRWKHLWGLVGLIGLSLFWTTETGFSILVAFACAAVILCGMRPLSWVKSCVLAVSSFAFFMLLNFLAFGGGVFSPVFLYEGVLSPLIIYGSGYGAILITWSNDLTYLANFIVPILAVASLGLLLSIRIRKQEIFSSVEEALIVVNAILAVLLSAKYLNRSFMQNWHVTCFPALILLAIWLKIGCKALIGTGAVNLYRKKERILGLDWGWLCNTLVILLALIYISFTPEPAYAGKGFPEGLRAYTTYDSLLNRFVFHTTIAEPDKGKAYWAKERISSADTALIQKYTPAGKPLMLFGFDNELDWEYYLSAQRLPASPVVPATVIFSTWQWQLFVDHMSEYIYLPWNGGNLEKMVLITDAKLDRRLKDEILPQYEFVENADTLAVYRRK